MVEVTLLTCDKKVCGAILTDQSKAFDWISHDLLVAKVNAYGFDWNAFNPLQPGVAYLYPLKTSENFKVFWCFHGV